MLRSFPLSRLSGISLAFSLLQPLPRPFHALPIVGRSAGYAFCVGHETETGVLHCATESGASQHIQGILRERCHFPETALTLSPTDQKKSISWHFLPRSDRPPDRGWERAQSVFAGMTGCRGRHGTRREDTIRRKSGDDGARSSRWFPEQLFEF